MPSKPPPRCPKGFRWPGSGWPKGQPAKVSVDARQLVSELVNDPVYQHRLRGDFRARKLHPTIEALVWAYYIGKPRQPVDIDARIDVTARMETERRIFAALSYAELEELAAASQALVDRAAALANVRAGDLPPQDIVVAPNLPEVSAESLGKQAGSDNGYFVNHELADDDDDETPHEPTG